MEAVVRAADAARRELWRVATRTELGRRCARERETRLVVLAVVHLSVALLLTAWIPLWLLLLGPLVLGVPHVVADVRYLLFREPGRPLVRALLIPLGMLTVLRLVVALGGPQLAEAEVGLGAAALLAAAMTAVPGWRRNLVLAGTSAVAALGFAYPHLAALGLGHLHNVVGFALWAWWARKTRLSAGALLIIAAAYVGAITLLMTGGISLAGLATDAVGLDYFAMADTLAPGLEPELAARLILTFAFAQAVHYAVWLRLVPGTPPYTSGPVAPSFRRALHDLRRDIGPRGLMIALALTVAVPAWGLLDPIGAREGYLSIVLFHGWLELAVVARILSHRAAQP